MGILTIPRSRSPARMLIRLAGRDERPSHISGANRGELPPADPAIGLRRAAAGPARFFGTSERFSINFQGRYDRLGSRLSAGSLGGVAFEPAPVVRPQSGRVTVVRAG
jgi:hypothetical protein